MKMMQFFKIGSISKGRKNREKGQVFAIVLVLLLIVSAIIIGTLTVVGTTLKTNRTYINNTTSLYSAEAGIQDGIWNLLYQSSSDLADATTGLLKQDSSQSTPKVDYTEYDFNDDGWKYQLPDPATGSTTPTYTINTYPVDVTIKNVWVPLIDTDSTPPWIPSATEPSPPGGTTPPSTIEANNVLNNTGGTAGKNLSVSGQLVTNLTYEVDIVYTGTTSLPILSIGCWLPQGFNYANGSSNLQQTSPNPPLYATEQVLPCAGNQAVVWTFPSGTTFASLLAALGETGSIKITFHYVATNPNKTPDAVGWIVNTPNIDFPYSYTWNADVKVHKIIAGAGTTEIESFLPSSGVRNLGSAIAGDYLATGGSVLTDLNGDGLRETTLSSSSSTVSGVPSDAMVEGAFLYWAGWVRGDNINGNLPTLYYDPSVTLVVNSSGSQTITADPSTDHEDIIWYDEVRSGRSGTITFTPTSKIVNGSGTHFTGDVNVDDKISPNVKNAGGTYDWYTVASIQSDTKLTLTANSGSSLAGSNYCVFDGYYYGCKKDVTEIVRNYSNGAVAGPPKVKGKGNGNYTISDLYADTASVQHPGNIGDSAYAGWSLVIVYSDANTTGHQLYLFDVFRSIPNNSGNNLFDISGFITPNRIASESTSADAVKLTVFVGEGDNKHTPDHVGLFDKSGVEHWLWDGVTTNNNTQSNPNNAFNSQSIGLNAPGVDIDTFHIPWADNIIKAGDVSAKINIYTNSDGLVSIYVIASFRSEITSGGSISYLIRKRPAP